jgi:hypothetical protein
MSVKLVLLKSGEDVIADIQEMVVGESEETRKVVGYFFTKPCVVKMRTTEESKDKSYQISLFPWLPLSKDTKVPVINDWVITIVEPIDTLREMYENDVLKKKNDQTVSATEQSDLVISN